MRIGINEQVGMVQIGDLKSGELFRCDLGRLHMKVDLGEMRLYIHPGNIKHDVYSNFICVVLVDGSYTCFDRSVRVIPENRKVKVCLDEVEV